MVEGSINATQHSVRGNSSLLPSLDQRPIQGGQQQDGSSTSLEVLFDFREIVEVIVQERFTTEARSHGEKLGGSQNLPNDAPGHNRNMEIEEKAYSFLAEL